MTLKTMDKNIKFKIASNWFKILQEIICYEIIKLEGKNKSFEIKKWKRSKKLDEGGGESRILRNGKIFDISDKSVALIIKKYTSLAGLDEKNMQVIA